MTATDQDQRQYLNVKELRSGMIVEVDSGFTCLRSHSRHIVHHDDEGFFLRCDNGRHYFDTQTDEDGDIIGVYAVPPTGLH